MYSLSQRLPSSGISIFSIHPGYVDSEFIRGSADSKLHLFVELASKVLRKYRICNYKALLHRAAQESKTAFQLKFYLLCALSLCLHSKIMLYRVSSLCRIQEKGQLRSENGNRPVFIQYLFDFLDTQ